MCLNTITHTSHTMTLTHKQVDILHWLADANISLLDLAKLSEGELKELLTRVHNDINS